MFVTYLTCVEFDHTLKRIGLAGMFGFDVDWDCPRRPSECLWLVPGTIDG
jgi:hypothetical protein